MDFVFVGIGAIALLLFVSDCFHIFRILSVSVEMFDESTVPFQLRTFGADEVEELLFDGNILSIRV